MRFGVVAAGGVGGFFGGSLAHAGADVTFIARGAHLSAIRRDGLLIKGPNESFTVHPTQVTDDPSEVGIVDALIVAVKGWQLADLLPSLKAMVGRTTTVLPLLNGVEAPSLLGSALGPDCILGGMCNVMSYVGAPGVIEHKGTTAVITLGELGERDGHASARVSALRDALSVGGFKVVVPKDITVAMWKKFAFIAPFGGVGAVARAPAAAIRSVGATRAMLRAAVHEVVRVGQARGVNLHDDDVDATMTYADGLPADGYASMARDLFAGRRSELDALPGAVVRMGRKSGIATPVHEFIYGALLPTELRARGEVQYAVPPL